MEEQQRTTIQNLPEGWTLKYFDPTDPDYMAEYVNGPYMIRVTGGGADFNLQMHKGDFIEENINIIDLDKANDYALKLMQSVSDSSAIEEIRVLVREVMRKSLSWK